MKRRLILSIAVATLCLIATPVMADLFSVNLHGGLTTFDGTTLVTTQNTSFTLGSVIGFGHSAVVTWPSPGVADFLLEMQISGSGTTRIGSGEFTFRGVPFAGPPSYIRGDISGTWSQLAGSNYFSGTVSNVWFQAGTYGTFFGDDVSQGVPLSENERWIGTATILTDTAPWFDVSWDAGVSTPAVGINITSVAPVPIPGAVLLGFLGLSAAGVGLRKLT